MLEQLRIMVEEYVDLASELKRKAPALGALMGNRQDTLHPGHMAFYDGVAQWTERFAATGPNQEDLIQAMQIMLLSAYKYENTPACWYLIAIHSHCKGLISLLEENSREVIRNSYEAAYPRSTQLPLQKEIYRLLGGQRRRWFGTCNIH